MKAYQVDFDDYADIIDKSKILNVFSTAGGTDVYVVEFMGGDAFVITGPFDNGAIVIESDHAPFGGSTHEYARNAIAAGSW